MSNDKRELPKVKSRVETAMGRALKATIITAGTSNITNSFKTVLPEDTKTKAFKSRTAGDLILQALRNSYVIKGVPGEDKPLDTNKLLNPAKLLETIIRTTDMTTRVAIDNSVAMIQQSDVVQKRVAALQEKFKENFNPNAHANPESARLLGLAVIQSTEYERIAVVGNILKATICIPLQFSAIPFALASALSDGKDLDYQRFTEHIEALNKMDPHHNSKLIQNEIAKYTIMRNNVVLEQLSGRNDLSEEQKGWVQKFETQNKEMHYFLDGFISEDISGEFEQYMQAQLNDDNNVTSNSEAKLGEVHAQSATTGDVESPKKDQALSSTHQLLRNLGGRDTAAIEEFKSQMRENKTNEETKEQTLKSDPSLPTSEPQDPEEVNNIKTGPG